MLGVENPVIPRHGPGFHHAVANSQGHTMASLGDELPSLASHIGSFLLTPWCASKKGRGVDCWDLLSALQHGQSRMHIHVAKDAHDPEPAPIHIHMSQPVPRAK